MLLPFEFLFPRGFFAADILVVFPLTCFLKYWTDVNFWRIFDENVLERYSGDLLFKLCTCGLIIELWQVSRNGNILWIDCFFLGFDFWNWLPILLETVLCGSRTFAQDFVSSLFQSKACHLESIYGTDQNCTWELGRNTLEASCREFVSVIKDFASGFYLASKPGTFVRNCFCEVLGTICRDFVLSFYAIKGFCRGFCFRDSQLFM